jgi:hypothetical protein
MSSTNYLVTDTEYTLVSATDNVLQNKSSGYVRVIFGTVLPTVDDPNYYSIPPNQGFVTKDALPLGNTYVRADDGTANVVVGEG